MSSVAPTGRNRVFWMMTPACPSRCVYCGIEEHQRLVALDASRAVGVAREIVAAGFREVVLGGGEALIYKPVRAVVEALRGRVAVALFSGGVPGDVRRHVDTIGAGIERVVFSMDGPDAALNDRLRGRAGITEAVTALARAVRRELPSVSVSFNTVVSRHNCDRLLELFDLIASFEPNGWALTLVGDNYGIQPTSDIPSLEQLERLYLETIPEIARRAGGRRFDLVALPLPVAFLPHRWSARTWPEIAAAQRDAFERDLGEFALGNHNRGFAASFKCPLIGVDIGISAAGWVYPCSGFPTFEERYSMGDLTQSSLAEVLAGDRLRAFGDHFPSLACSRCWAPSNIAPHALDALIAPAPG